MPKRNDVDPFFKNFVYVENNGNIIALVLLDDPEPTAGTFRADAEDAQHNEYEITWAKPAAGNPDWSRYDVRLVCRRQTDS